MSEWLDAFVPTTHRPSRHRAAHGDAMTDFDPNWQYGHTRAGDPVRIICTDSHELGFADYPIVGLIRRADGSETLTHFRLDGQSGAGSAADLINAPAPKRMVKVDRWIDVYDDKSIYNRIARIHLTGEIAEGETREVKL